MHCGLDYQVFAILPGEHSSPAMTPVLSPRFPGLFFCVVGADGFLGELTVQQSGCFNLKPLCHVSEVIPLCQATVVGSHNDSVSYLDTQISLDLNWLSTLFVNVQKLSCA